MKWMSHIDVIKENKADKIIRATSGILNSNTCDNKYIIKMPIISGNK